MPHAGELSPDSGALEAEVTVQPVEEDLR